MNKLIISLGLIGLLSQSLMAQEDLKGIWWAEEGKVKVEIYQKTDETLAGKIVWLAKTTDKKGNLLTDKNNPDKALRSQPMMGLEMLENIRWENGQWKATVYSPKRGRRVNATMKLSDSDELQVKVSMMGMSRTRTWARASE